MRGPLVHHARQGFLWCYCDFALAVPAGACPSGWLTPTGHPPNGGRRCGQGETSWQHLRDLVAAFHFPPHRGCSAAARACRCVCAKTAVQCPSNAPGDEHATNLESVKGLVASAAAAECGPLQLGLALHPRPGLPFSMDQRRCWRQLHPLWPETLNLQVHEHHRCCRQCLCSTPEAASHHIAASLHWWLPPHAAGSHQADSVQWILCSHMCPGNLGSLAVNSSAS